MPVHPSEEDAPEGLTEKVAKDPSSNTESTASTHEDHHNEHTPADVKAKASDFQSKGPQIPTNMSGIPSPMSITLCYTDPRTDLPPKASKEELKARAEELNK